MNLNFIHNKSYGRIAEKEGTNAVPYQHFTNSIENYFSMLKSRLQKLDGLTREKLKENIEKVIKDIPKEKYENIFKGAYNKNAVYLKNNERKNMSKK